MKLVERIERRGRIGEMAIYENVCWDDFQHYCHDRHADVRTDDPHGLVVRANAYIDGKYVGYFDREQRIMVTYTPSIIIEE
jgi:hypothetical protein